MGGLFDLDLVVGQLLLHHLDFDRLVQMDATRLEGRRQPGHQFSFADAGLVPVVRVPVAESEAAGDGMRTRICQQVDERLADLRRVDPDSEIQARRRRGCGTRQNLTFCHEGKGRLVRPLGRPKNRPHGLMRDPEIGGNSAETPRAGQSTDGRLLIRGQLAGTTGVASRSTMAMPRLGWPA